MDPRYPIGTFTAPAEYTTASRAGAIGKIAALPGLLRRTVAGRSPEQLDTRYREGGWTIRQVVHHLPDSHMNAYVRFRLALTEDRPVIKAYEEARWAELADARSGPIEISLDLIDALHVRWVRLLEALGPAEFARTFKHPEMGEMSLDRTLAMYAWHGEHHVGQIASLAERMGWR
jgi:uncharacterized damage-inducible protein DinB